MSDLLTLWSPLSPVRGTENHLEKNRQIAETTTELTKQPGLVSRRRATGTRGSAGSVPRGAQTAHRGDTGDGCRGKRAHAGVTSTEKAAF